MKIIRCATKTEDLYITDDGTTLHINLSNDTDGVQLTKDGVLVLKDTLDRWLTRTPF